MKTEVLEKKIKLLSVEQKLKLEHVIDDMLRGEVAGAPHTAVSHEVLHTLDIKPGFGGGKGIFGYMADDFDEPLEDFKDYM